jgi:conjugal transfer mating pair stabilization protein TraN
MFVRKVILKKAFTLVIGFIFLFTQTVGAVDLVCYIPNEPIKTIPQYNPTTGFCETSPLDEYNNCPDGYRYYLWLGTCAALPRCVGNYTYDLGTKSCVPIDQTQGGNETIPYNNICAIDRNGDGEITQDEMTQCIPADDGSFICPLDATPCQPKYVVPNCPSEYTYDKQDKICQADRTCPDDGSFQYINNQTICVTEATIDCPNGQLEYQNGAPVCNVNGNYTSANISCPDEYSYNSTLQVCVGSPVCPSGGSFNEKTGKCEVVPTCPSGGTLTDNGCFMGNFCPYGNYPCKPVNGVMKCSASQCWQSQDLKGDDLRGPGDYGNDGQSNSTEQCLGQIYIFNGKAQRCRPPGWQVGLFNDCCDSSLAKGKVLYDSTGSSGMDLSMVKYASTVVKYSYDIARFGYLFANGGATGTIHVYVGTNVILISKTVDFDYHNVVAIYRGTPEWQATMRTLQNQGIPSNPGSIAEVPTGEIVSLDAMKNYVEVLGPQIAWSIFHLATSGLIKDPHLSAIIGLAADAAVLYLQSAGIIQGITLVTPVGLALSAIGVVMSFVFGGGCDKEDVMTVIQRESGRCHYVGKRCIKKIKTPFGKVCVQHGKFYCCFNSKLAKIIHERGRPQLNTDIRNWGDAKHPNCRGFTPEEFASLDFDKIDLTDYFTDLTRNMHQDVAAQTQRLFDDTIQTQFSH